MGYVIRDRAWKVFKVKGEIVLEWIFVAVRQIFGGFAIHWITILSNVASDLGVFVHLRSMQVFGSIFCPALTRYVLFLGLVDEEKELRVVLL